MIELPPSNPDPNKGQMLLVDTTDLSPVCWVHDLATAIEYVSLQPVDKRHDFAIYSFHSLVTFTTKQPKRIPLLDTKVDRIEIDDDGKPTYFLSPAQIPEGWTKRMPICGCEPDSPGCPVCVGEENA